MATVQRAAQLARLYPLPAATLLGLLAGLIAQYLLGLGSAAQWIWLATLLVGGSRVVVRTLDGMLKGRFATDIVASLAIIGAGVTQEYFAGCVIVLMQTGGEALEAFAVRRASSSLEELLAHAPTIAHRKRDGDLEDVPISNVKAGDRLLIRPGEIVPVDGVVAGGTSMVDESALTGEPIPVTKGVDDEVMSGSVASDGALDILATRPSSESQYEQIVRLVRQAQANKAPIARLADRYAVIFTPFTLMVGAAGYLLTGRPETVVAVLVVATPCPLILATPVAIISGISRAARRGIIVKDGAAIERVGKVVAAVFDKTGTITVGTPYVERIVALDGISTREILRLAAGLEQLSSHPMARALVQAGGRELPELPMAEGLAETAGQGVSGRVDGHLVDVGSAAYAESRGLLTPLDLEEIRVRTGTQANSLSMIGIDHKAAGMVVYADPLRPNVPSLMKRLSDLGVHTTAMLTGDDEATARRVASQAGISKVAADLLPGQKVDAIRELMGRHGDVVMVGDGINDAPALAAATVGIALGAHGSAVSAEAADIVITTDDIGRVADAIEIGQFTTGIALQSIWVGLGASGAMMLVAAAGFIPPALGAMLQEAVDITVILNALRAR